MENKITISSLSSALSQTTGKSKKLCDDFLKEYFKVITACLENGESLKIKGFGSFKIVEVEGRSGINVTTGERQEIAAYKKVVFTPAKELANEINAPFMDFDTIEMDDEIPEDVLIESPEEVLIKTPEELLSPVSEELSKENEVSEERLEQGSDKEGEDDDITAEAYILEDEADISSEAENVSENLGGKEENAEREESIAERQVNEIPALDDGPIVNINQYEANDEEKPVKSKFALGFLVGSISTLAVCVIIFMLGCFFNWWPVNFGKVEGIEVVKEQPVPVDTQAVEDPTFEGANEAVDPVYDTVSKTRFLTTIAREYYGNYNFWPYIYKENESILGHPDRITPGTKVIVPDLSKYGVNPENKGDEEKAKKLGAEIYARFK